MKNFYTLLILLCTFWSQAQNGITYQAVILNPNSEELPGADNSRLPLVNQSICLEFKIFNAASGLDYHETINTQTDDYGMVNVIIGTGTRKAGIASQLSAINWDGSAKNLVVSLDPTSNCSNFVKISDQPFTYVPFALYAVNTGVNGTQGPAGNDGLDGKTLLNGTINPIGSIGSNGDFYINTTTNNLFGPKTNNVWGNGVPLVGPQGIQGIAGPTGSTGLQGIAGINGSNGQDGLSAYQIWLNAGNTGTEAQFLTALRGATGAQGPQGIQGIQGSIGLTGATGPQGTAGTNGTNGTNGATWLSGNTSPDTNIGSINDFYLNTTNGEYFKKTAANLWTQQGNLTGPAGAQGTSNSNGTANSIYWFKSAGLSNSYVESNVNWKDFKYSTGFSSNNDVIHDSTTGEITFTKSGVYKIEYYVPGGGNYIFRGIQLLNYKNTTWNTLTGINARNSYDFQEFRSDGVVLSVSAGEKIKVRVDGNAYEISVIISETGVTGPQGIAGINGSNGQDGLSAYQIWLNAGNTGTESQFLTALQGATGAQGPQGIQGATGPQGIAGTNGANGLDGKTILNGNQDPINSVGNNGDFYINTTTNLLFGPKTSGAWGSGIALVGPQGAAGVNGKNSLINTTTVSVGSNDCPNGGIKIEVGLDLNNNGILESNEIENSKTKYICQTTQNSGRVFAINSQGTYQVPSGKTWTITNIIIGSTPPTINWIGNFVRYISSGVDWSGYGNWIIADFGNILIQKYKAEVFQFGQNGVTSSSTRNLSDTFLQNELNISLPIVLNSGQSLTIVSGLILNITEN